MKIAVVGLKHLGWVTAACLAAKDHSVYAIDQIAEYPKDEPELEEMIQIGCLKNNLKTVEFEFIEECEVVWITYDTPVSQENKIDTSYVFRKIDFVMQFTRKDVPIIISSQLPVGSIKSLEKVWPNPFICIPENLRHGTAVENFMKPDRVVVGIRDKNILNRIHSILAGYQILVVDIESAEMIKHAINSFLATEITFANELGDICKKHGINYDDVLKGLLTEERIGSKARLKTGSAYRGGTLARDINYLINLMPGDSIFNYVRKSNSYRVKRENGKS